MSWAAKYYRYAQEYTLDFDTPRKAIEFLDDGADAGALSVVSIVSSSGEEVAPRSERWKELRKQNWPDEQGVLF